MSTEIDNIKAKNETYVLAGDLNCHLGSYIPGNNPKVSTAGKLLIEFLEDEENILVNSTGKVHNGPFTRYEKSHPDDASKKSAIDLVLISSSLDKYVESMTRDKNLDWTPSKVSNGVLKYHDHYTIKLCFNNIPIKKDSRKVIPCRKQTIFNTKKENGCIL